MEKKLGRKFTSINDVTFEDVIYILHLWETNEANEKDVFSFAEHLYYLDEPGWPDYPRDDNRSILFAALESLEMMYSQPTLKNDIPALKKFLIMGQSSPVDAWQFIDKYWDSINWEERVIEFHNTRYESKKRK